MTMMDYLKSIVFTNQKNQGEPPSSTMSGTVSRTATPVIARDDVGQALEVLDVQGGLHVDARDQQFLDVLPALGWREPGALVWASSSTMISWAGGPAPRRGPSPRSTIAPAHDAPRQHFEAARQRFGLVAAVGLDQPDDDVDALVAQQARPLQHRVGLADARRRAEKDQQSAAFLLFRQREQRVGVGSAFGVAFVGHRGASS